MVPARWIATTRYLILVDIRLGNVRSMVYQAKQENLSLHISLIIIIEDVLFKVISISQPRPRDILVSVSKNNIIFQSTSGRI